MAKQKILIVEDEENISALIDYNLKNNGFDSVVAPSGEDALQLLAKNRFELAILDVHASRDRRVRGLQEDQERSG